MPIKPKSRPNLAKTVVRQVAERVLRENPNCDGPGIMAACAVMILGVRGYYRDTLGRLGINDFGVFDDAGFLIAPNDVLPFNRNCDPSKKGWNPGVGKNYAQLMPGVWAFRQGPHKGTPGALRQLTNEEAATAKLDKFFTDDRSHGYFVVRRVEDDNVGKLETQYQAVNIHRGSATGTSSWGCQTLPPEQWQEFSDATYAAMNEHEQTWAEAQKRFGWIPYILTEEKLA